MKKFSKKILVAIALAVVLALVIAVPAMAAGPNNADCPNNGTCQYDGVCPYNGDGPADGTGMQKRAQSGAALNGNGSCCRLNADGECTAAQTGQAWRHSYNLTAE